MFTPNLKAPAKPRNFRTGHYWEYIRFSDFFPEGITVSSIKNETSIRQHSNRGFIHKFGRIPAARGPDYPLVSFARHPQPAKGYRKITAQAVISIPHGEIPWFH
jgi:hypothetical protein